jgi:tetratricopeptide (TPR) repeat protein
LQRAAADHPPAGAVRQPGGSIDLPRNRWRLWSLADSQLLYFLTHYNAGHENRKKECLGIKQAYAKADNDLGVVLARCGRTGEAIKQYRQALELWPDCDEAHLGLGAALAGRGQLHEAIAHFQRALKINPGYAEAHVNLGAALAARGRIDEAIAHFQEALKINPGYAEAHANFAVALARCGRTDGAIGHFQAALELAERQNNAVLAEQLRTRLRAYDGIARPAGQPPSAN